MDLKPHRIGYWLTPKIEDEELFRRQLKEVCEIYKKAIHWHTQNIYVVSLDEMTGIQALERIAPSLPMKPRKIELREFEYIRHGTLSLIASFMVATGEVIPSIGPTRTEADLVAHLHTVIQRAPEDQWIFIMDQLNTHKSEGAVRLVAEYSKLNQDLGNKGKSGVLENMKTREAFLTDPEHQIRFVYVPKHTSWLNQIERWFSILVRKLLKRAHFNSLRELKERVLKFIEFFNQTMAKPFKWTYLGKPLQG